MTKQEAFELIFEFLYECCNMPATSLRLDGGTIQLYVDGTFSCNLEIKEDSVEVYDDDKGEWKNIC